MDYEHLKEEIKYIVEIAASVPEAFREKCFELLLNNLLSGKAAKAQIIPTATTAPVPPPASTSAIPLHAHVKAFMRRKGITSDQIESIVMLEDGDIHFLKEPAHGQAAKGQVDWALLLALKNGILNNTLKVDPEEVRSMVQEKGFYDPANYAANFKKPKYAAFFRAALEPQGEPQSLSGEGETALAELIKALASGS
ncbi:MAG: hypothetical protein E6K65_14190 [Nitrospirae bacterium]|nr:MAG: hypothetical protein E6K65_14190 [Nitrospirota bacterium]